jgi:hypothetical protein
MRRLDLFFLAFLPKHQIHSQIEVNATPDVVWRILIDFRSYPKWSPLDACGALKRLAEV